jgi:hypothetical protein
MPRCPRDRRAGYVYDVYDIYDIYDHCAGSDPMTVAPPAIAPPAMPELQSAG